MYGFFIYVEKNSGHNQMWTIERGFCGLCQWSIQKRRFLPKIWWFRWIDHEENWGIEWKQWASAVYVVLTSKERAIAIDDLRKSPLITAKDIELPCNFSYEKVQYDYFDNKKAEMLLHVEEMREMEKKGKSRFIKNMISCCNWHSAECEY